MYSQDQVNIIINSYSQEIVRLLDKVVAKDLKIAELTKQVTELKNQDGAKERV